MGLKDWVKNVVNDIKREISKIKNYVKNLFKPKPKPKPKEEIKIEIPKPKEYVRFTVKGLARDNQNHDCVTYINFYLYAEADMFDEINNEIEFLQKTDRQNKYLNENYDDYGLTVEYQYVDEKDVNYKKLVTDIRQIDTKVFDTIKKNIKCGKEKGRVKDIDII